VNYRPWSILLHCYYCLQFTRFIYILANYYLLPLDTLNPLFTANGEIDNLTVSWDKVLGCVVCRFLMTHKYRGCIVVLSINKSLEPNEEQKVLISGFDQGFTINTSKRVFKGIW
jgi:hypothetical protein